MKSFCHRNYATSLFDAFERSAAIATTCKLVQGADLDCDEQIEKIMVAPLLESYSKTLNGKSFSEASPTEQEAVRKVVGPRASSVNRCGIDDQPVDCAKAANFIAEHMKN
jgi:hypothetical protein